MCARRERSMSEMKFPCGYPSPGNVTQQVRVEHTLERHVPLNPVPYMFNDVSFNNCPIAAAGRTPRSITRMCARRERSMSEMKNPDYIPRLRGG